VKRLLVVTVLFAGDLAGQTLVVDRPVAAGATAQAIELADGGFLGDAFQLGVDREVWVIDSIRVWVARYTGAGCPAKLGDQIAKITLYGALENLPAPGEPDCKCHALVPVRSVGMQPGTNSSVESGVKIAPSGAFWQIDFDEVRWSLPGDAKVLFAVRAAPRVAAACTVAKAWSLSASPAGEGYRLHRFDRDLVPEGPAAPDTAPKRLNIQVRAHRQP